MSLIESLVALVVLALGVMGLAGVQARMLAETRTTNSRAIAVNLIDDMANRVLLNREHAMTGGYNLAFADATPAAVDCAAIACSNAQMANSDRNAWRLSVEALLGPGGRSAIFQSVTDPRQIGIMVGWPVNEGKSRSDGSSLDAAYTAPFTVNTGIAAVACPVNLMCHLVYLLP